MDQREGWDAFYRANRRAWRGNSRVPDPLGGAGDALDLGCGNGKTASTLADMGYRVAGIDFSEEAVSLCREVLGDAGTFLVADVADLPFPDGSFDYVTAVHVLEHVTDWEMPRVASEISRVMRPGAWLFVRSFTPDDMRSGSRADGGIRYVHRRPDDIVALLPGLEPVSADTVEERTRFGTVRSRAECLLRKPSSTCAAEEPADNQKS